jgi:L-fucose isomerase-like protein
MVLRIILLGFASELHGVEYFEELFNEITNTIASYPGIVVDKIYTEYERIDLENYDLVLAALLTGGTSSLSYRMLHGINKPIVLLAHNKHNSLASALSARMRFQSGHDKVLLLHFKDKNDLLMKFSAMYRGFIAAYNLRRIRILEINDLDRISDSGSLFKSRIGGEIIHVKYDELWRVLERMPRDELVNIRKYVSEYIDLSGINDEYLEKILSIYYALRKMVEEYGVNAVVIDCFPFVIKYHVTPCLAVAMLNNDGIPTACENDYYSLIPLYISLALTGNPGWIANPSGVTSDGYLRFAHCTIAPGLGKDCFLTPHFETGYPYGVVCRFKNEKLLFMRFTSNYSKLVVYRGKRVRSGLLEPGYCRTQLVIDTGPYSPERFIEEAIGNHHVFMPWSNQLVESLKYMAWWMGWELEMKN